MTSLAIGLGGKRLEVLRDLIPSIKTVGYLINPTSSAAPPVAQEMEVAARTLGISTFALPVQKDDDFQVAFERLSRQSSVGLLVGGDQFHLSRRKTIVSLAARYRVPTVYPSRPYVMEGGLLGYGINTALGHAQLGNYAGRVLNGEKPSDLPVLQLDKFELLINLKAAKALGLEVPIAMLYRADDAIE
jgi:putative ABC transport system substrate-binding protein